MIELTNSGKKTVSVSIVTANYNNGHFIKEFINSINKSTVLPQELIIVDDGSSDNSLKVLEEFSDLRYLKVINLGTNRGFCNALNEGIKVASGRYIMRVDPDDIVSEKRIQKQVDYLEQNINIDILGSNACYFQRNLSKEIGESNFPIDHNSIASKYHKGEHGVLHGTTMIKTCVMKKYKYEQENVKSEDYEIFARMISDKYKFANLSDVLTKVRIHGDSVSNNIEFCTIKKTYQLRDKIFNTNTSLLRIWFYYLYILNYRRSLFTKNKVMSFLFLIISIAFYPSKLFRRIFI